MFQAEEQSRAKIRTSEDKDMQYSRNKSPKVLRLSQCAQAPGSTPRAINHHLKVLSKQETLWKRALGPSHLTNRKLRPGEVLGLT